MSSTAREGSPTTGGRPRPAAPVVIEGTGVTKRWGANTVLSGATFTIHAGVTGLLGSNGAGKTTLLGMILGLHRPDGGTLSVLGLDPATAGPDVRARIGYSPEHHRLPPDAPVNEFVAHIAQVHGLPRRAAINRASDALWHVGLGEERFRPLGTMSTGQRQRAKLAQALVHDPALILLDEPTDGLDPLQRDDMLDLIRRVGTDFGIHILLSSHLLEEVERVCDAAVILRDGVVAATGTIDELRGTSQGVVVELVGSDTAISTALGALRTPTTTVSVDGPRIRVEPSGTGPVDDDLLFDLVRDVAVTHRVGIRSLHAHRVTLEDVFIGMNS